MAGDLEFGVASRANLYLIKQEGYFTNSMTGETWSRQVTTSGITHLITKILDVINTEQIPEGRAVVTLNASSSSPNMILVESSRLTTHRFRERYLLRRAS